MKRIVVKDSKGVVVKEVKLEELNTLDDLRKNFHDDSYLIFRGQIMEVNNNFLTISELFDQYNTPIVYLVNKSSKTKEVKPLKQAREFAAQTIRPPYQNEESTTIEENRCRICYSNENYPNDRLFRPCLCRGSVGYVHISCLNAWRERPDNPDAYFRCANCGYEYRIFRTRFASFLSSERFVQIVAVSYLLMIILIFVFFSWLFFPPEISERFFELIEWQPPDEDYPFVRHFVFGASGVGLTGFAMHLSELIDFVRNHGTIENVFGIGIALTANGSRGIRIFAVCGLAVAFTLLYRQSQRFTRKILTQFGERVLAVSE